MDPTKYIWKNGKLVHWDEAQIHVLSHGLHYGSAVFEGLRFYKTQKGTAVFRLKEHTDRLFYSAKCLQMEIPYSKEEINQAHINLLKENQIDQGYIRPLVYYGYGKMGLNPKGAPVEVAIACWPWGAYLPPEGIDVKITKYIRIHPKSTICDAKICGHYVNSILSVQEIEGSKYQEAMLLDYEGNIAEGPGENFFMVKGNIIYTPPLGAILNGITRATIMKIAKDLGHKVVEKTISPEEAFNSDEAFYTGSAAEVSPIKSIDDNIIGTGEIGPVTKKIRDTYMDAVFGRNKKYEHYLTYID
jgi:branched-chain amino acid aminotransferase